VAEIVIGVVVAPKETSAWVSSMRNILLIFKGKHSTSKIGRVYSFSEPVSMNGTEEKGSSLVR
jgi:hypothetical protein